MGTVTYTQVEAKSALNRLKRKIPYGWDLNIYRGCQHGCRYCYALYSHQYLGAASFSREIFIKTNIAERLEAELSAPGWKGEVINIGGVTDSYQPAEESFRLMPMILKLLIKHKNPAIISTKSDLVLRDYDLIDEMSRLTYINIAATVTVVDEAVREQLEPGAVSSARRFAMLKELRKTRASTGLHLMPIIPGLTASAENLQAICEKAAQAGVDYLLPGTLYLRGKTRPAFFDFIGKHYPEHLARLEDTYEKGGAAKSCKEEIYAVLNPIREQYGLSGSYMKPMREKMGLRGS